MEEYTFFDKSIHLVPEFDKEKFEKLHLWDLGWALVEAINIAPDKEKEKELSKRLSPGQKALYFYWYLDAQITNGGFIQFYWNGYRRYLTPILDGLKLIGDKNILALVEAADKEYLLFKSEFEQQRAKDDWEPLYENLKNFDSYDKLYFENHNQTISIFEKYIRRNSEEFVKLK